MPVPAIEQLLGTSHFRVLVGRREIGVCSVGPISSEVDADAEPGERRDRFATIVLRRALSRSTDLFDWRRAIVAGKRDRRTVTIEQLASAGGAVVNAWRLERAWPCRWSGPGFDALATGIACEELELAFDDVVWLPPVGPKVPPRKLPARRRPTSQGE
jgi:hypothetical protein